MEKISYLTRRRIDNNKTPNEKQPKEVAFLVLTAFVLFGPTVLLCLTLGQTWPLVMMAGSDVLGATLGVVKFNRPSRAVVSCLPSHGLSITENSHTETELKKAA